MRTIGSLDQEQDARTFGNFLYVQGIENTVDREDGRWAIWVHSDDELARARQLLGEFTSNPADPRFHEVARPAEQLREEKEERDAAYRKKVITGRQLFPETGRPAFGPVTHALIFASIAVFVLTRFGSEPERAAALYIGQYDGPGHPLGALVEIRTGQVWRLITPILLHFGIWHILFNMLWLRDLGNKLEARLGSRFIAAFVVIVAVLSNLTQFKVGGPGFGGMSGVVYALIGYVWVRGHFDPGAGIFLDRQSLIFALIWFAAGFTGMWPIANGAHASGLVLGAAWAFIDSKRR